MHSTGRGRFHRGSATNRKERALCFVSPGPNYSLKGREPIRVLPSPAGPSCNYSPRQTQQDLEKISRELQKKKNDRWLTLWGAEILGHHLLTLLCQHGSLKPLAFTWPPKENKEQGEARCSARGCAGRGSRCCSEGAWGRGMKPQGRLRAQWGDATGWRSWGEKLG